MTNYTYNTYIYIYIKNNMYLSYYTLYPRLSAVEMGPCHPSELWLGKFVMRYFEPYTVYTFINVYIYNYLVGKNNKPCTFQVPDSSLYDFLKFLLHNSSETLILVWNPDPHAWCEDIFTMKQNKTWTWRSVVFSNKSVISPIF